MIIKNNNNHTRIEYLSNHFKKAYFLLMYRNPISHARSLLSQHLNFIHKQTEEPFILEYMNLIGHNEFGKNVVPFIYPTDKKDNWHKIIPKNTLDYWLVQWINTYRWILKSNVLDKDNIYLVCYEELCKNDSLYISICRKIGLENVKSGNPFTSGNKLNEDTSFIKDKFLIDEAEKIYDNLKIKKFS